MFLPTSETFLPKTRNSYHSLVSYLLCVEDGVQRGNRPSLRGGSRTVGGVLCETVKSVGAKDGSFEEREEPSYHWRGTSDIFGVEGTDTYFMFKGSW